MWIRISNWAPLASLRVLGFGWPFCAWKALLHPFMEMNWALLLFYIFDSGQQGRYKWGYHLQIKISRFRKLNRRMRRMAAGSEVKPINKQAIDFLPLPLFPGTQLNSFPFMLKRETLLPLFMFPQNRASEVNYSKRLGKKKKNWGVWARVSL